MSKNIQDMSKESNTQIQWKTTQEQAQVSWVSSHSVETLFLLSVITSILFEYFFGYGAFSLIICGVLSFIYEYAARDHDNIPSIGFIPLIGHFITTLIHFDRLYDKQVEDVLQVSKNNNGKPVPILSMSLPKRHIVWIYDPTLADIVFRRQFGDAIKEQKQYDVLKELLGKGIFSSNGNVWKKHRAIASRMFTTRSLRDYMFKNFMETTDKLINKCDELSRMNGKNGIDMYDMYLRLTFEAFTRSAFGIDIDAIDVAPKVVPFAYAFDQSLEICGTRFLNLEIIWKLKRYFDIGNEKELRKHSELMEAFIKDLIEKRKEYFATLKSNEESNKTGQVNVDLQDRNELRKRYDLLSLFIKDNPNINDTELRDISMNFIIAGRDTTAQTLGWFTYEMTKTDAGASKVNASTEEKIRKEIESVLHKNNETVDKISYKSINDMKYLEAALLETLRLHPSVPNLVRKALVDINFGEITGDKNKYNYILRKGDEVIIAARTMGRLPWVWDEPLAFRPERFYDSKTNKIIEYSGSKYPAFNLNPRMCLGKNLALLEAKLAVVKLFAKYKNINIVPNQNITYAMAATNHMKNGIKVVLS